MYLVGSREAALEGGRQAAFRSGEVGLLASTDGGALVRVIAGDLGAVKGPGSTHTPITLLHATLAPGAQLDLPWRALRHR